jgi:hypothetical protein
MKVKKAGMGFWNGSQKDFPKSGEILGQERVPAAHNSEIISGNPYIHLKNGR